jgi:hypothetical protein
VCVCVCVCGVCDWTLVVVVISCHTENLREVFTFT